MTNLVLSMESMVTDPDMEKVIIVSDRVYSDKSDNRKGGAGVMFPAPLLAGGWIDVAQGRPEPKVTIARGKIGCNGQPPIFQIAQKVPPAASVLPEPIHDGQYILVAILISPDNNQHTLAIIVQTQCEVNPIGPEVDVALAAQVALALQCCAPARKIYLFIRLVVVR